jgi:hypothetical protein
MFFDHRPRTAMVVFTDGVDTGSDVYKKDDDIVTFLRESGVLTYVIQHFSFDHYWRVHYPVPENPDVRNLPPISPDPGGPIFTGRTERDWAEYKIRKTYESAVGFVKRLGDAGGGGSYTIASLAEMPAAYEKIARELLESYTIGFKSAARSTNEPLRKIRVRTTREGVAGFPRPAGYPQ